jgi:hypothetical protein
VKKQKTSVATPACLNVHLLKWGRVVPLIKFCSHIQNWDAYHEVDDVEIDHPEARRSGENRNVHVNR